MTHAGIFYSRVQSQTHRKAGSVYATPILMDKDETG